MQVKFPKLVFLPDDQPRITQVFLHHTQMVVDSLFDSFEFQAESARALAAVDGLIWG